MFKFGVLDITLLYPLLLCVAFFLKDLIYYYYPVLKEQIFAFLFLLIISKFLSSLIPLYFYFQEESEAPPFFKENKITKKSLLFQLFATSIAEFIGLICNYYVFSNEDKEKYSLFKNVRTIPKGITIFITGILSRFILKIKIFRHKKFALGVLALGVILYSSAIIAPIRTAENVKDKFKECSLYFAVSLANCILISIQEVCEKRLMLVEFVNPYLIMFIESLYQIAYYLIFICIFNKNGIKNQFIDLGNSLINVYPIIATVLFILDKIFQYICKIQTINKLTPTHRTITDSLNSVYIIFIFKEKLLITMSTMGFILCVLGCLIYNEFLVVTFWKLDRYTKGAIIQRQEKENTIAFQEIDDIAQENDLIPSDAGSEINSLN